MSPTLPLPPNPPHEVSKRPCPPKGEEVRQPNSKQAYAYDKRQDPSPPRYPYSTCHTLILPHSLPPQNAAIAREALELLVTCLKLRSHLLNMFYTLPHIGDFIIDILLGSPHVDIRLSVVEQLIQLCSINTGETEIT